MLDDEKDDMEFAIWLIGIAGAIWIAVIAFRSDDTIWGIASIICGLAALAYGIMHFDEAKVPVILIVASMVLTVIWRVTTFPVGG